MDAPAISVGASRDSAFAAQIFWLRTMGLFGAPGGRVAVSQDQWRALVDSVQRSVVPPQPAPAIDFDRESVAIVAMGSRPLGGYVIRVRRVVSVRDTTFVLSESLRPGPDCVVATMVTAPFDARILPKSAEPVVFLNAPMVHYCEADRDKPDW